MRISDWSSDVCSSDLPDERAGEPARRRKAAVDHHAMIADTMPKQQRGARRDKEEKDCRRRDEEEAGDQCNRHHATAPDDTWNIGADAAVARIGAGVRTQEIDRIGIIIAAHPPHPFSYEKT